MNEPPDILNAFLDGTIFFSTTTFISAGTYTFYKGHFNRFRYSFFTSLNVGVAGGLFTGSLSVLLLQHYRNVLRIGIRACLLRLPGQLKGRELRERDYLFASGISAGFVGGTFNLINSRGPRMAIPGAIIFTLAGISGQLVLNAIDRWRVRYIYEHEDEWAEQAQLSELQKMNHGGIRNRDNPAMERHKELDRKFGFLEGLATVRSKGTSERRRLLVDEIEKLDAKIRKVDEEIEALERTTNDQGHGNEK